MLAGCIKVLFRYPFNEFDGMAGIGRGMGLGMVLVMSVGRSLCEYVVAGLDEFDRRRSGESGAGEEGVRCYEWSVGRDGG
jgi:hypothetical protein